MPGGTPGRRLGEGVRRHGRGPRGLFHHLAEGLGAGLPYAALTAEPVLGAELLPGPSSGA
ncbi:hypothetical protein OIE69_33140 [Actinacidiphila glaucinigra]|uniref:hypothetical protein n=1 Tax=Actinacidiphila glaucinigra TaxID=235986 RepID=UPI002DD9688E|nr:hypothetical protein [Actinacidiphila glaucinigra]WSD63387.1 hypothetical protein OIE69_33140 [Actinacidiphila glaucinigra]